MIEVIVGLGGCLILRKKKPKEKDLYVPCWSHSSVQGKRRESCGWRLREERERRERGMLGEKWARAIQKCEEKITSKAIRTGRKYSLKPERHANVLRMV